MGAIALDFAALTGMPRPQLQPAPPQDMVGLVKKVWLLLYSEGGFWTVSELRDRLKVQREIRTHLAEMVERGFLVRRKHADMDGKETVQYSVTMRCKVPRGVTIEEMWAVLQIGRKGPA